LPDVPSFDIDVPTLDVKAPNLDWSGIDPHKPILNPPDMSLKTPEVDLPDVSLNVPEVDPPDMSLKMPEVDLPDVSTQIPDVSADASGSGFLDAAKVAVLAAGAGLTAKVASALTSAEELPKVDVDLQLDASPDADWLLRLIQQTKAAYRGRNARAVSRLWGSDSHYDCAALDDYESIRLQPATYDKLGSSHCGVPRAGFVAVGGDVGNVELGGGILFHYCNIVVCRGADDTHHFIRVVAD